MSRFRPTRPPATRLVIPLPKHLRAADRALTRRATSAASKGRPIQAARRALDIAVAPKAHALTGFLKTLRADQPTAVFARNSLEAAAALRAAAAASAAPTTDFDTWNVNGGTLVIQATPATPDLNIAQALYAIFLGRPVRLSTMKRLELLAAVNGPKEPPYIVHLIAEPSLDSRLAAILLHPEP